MKLFIDTNIFVEYFEKRTEFDSVQALFNTLEDGIHFGYISVGSFYTLAYIADQGFKRKGYDKTAGFLSVAGDTCFFLFPYYTSSFCQYWQILVIQR